MTLAPVDLFISLVTLYNLWQGYRRGLLRGIFFLLGLLAATFAALTYYSVGGDYLSGHAAISHPWAEFISFSFIWLSITLLSNWLGQLLKKAAKYLFINWLDCFGGAALGLLKGLLIISLILVSITRLPLAPRVEKPLQESVLAKPLLKFTPILYLHVVKLFRDPTSKHYLKWHSDIEKIYQDFIQP